MYGNRKMAEQLIEQAFQETRISKQQKDALLRHAAKHSEEHVKHMLLLMAHVTFRTAHRQALEAVGK